MTDDAAPAPLVPAEIDLRGYEYMPLYGHKLFGSEFDAKASDTVFRVSVKLWWTAWNQVPAGSLPNDDVALTKYADFGRDVKGFRKVKGVALHGFILCSDGRLYHRRLAEWVIEAWELRDEHRERQANAKERQRRHRAERARLFTALRDVGDVPAYDTPTETLRATLKSHGVTVTGDATVTVTATAKKGSRSEGTGSDVSNRGSEGTPTIPGTANGSHPAVENIAGQGKGDGKGMNWDDPGYVAETGKSLAILRHQGEDDASYRDRVISGAQRLRVIAEAETARRAGA